MSWKEIIKLDPPKEGKGSQWNAPTRNVWEGEEWQPGQKDVKGEWYVSQYSDTHHYGGPEEGGWWYWKTEYIKSIGPYNREIAEIVRSDLNDGKLPDPVDWRNFPERDEDIMRGMLAHRETEFILERENGKGQRDNTKDPPPHYT